MPVTSLNDITPKEIMPGFYGKLIHASESTLIFWQVKAGSSFPLHYHVHEQITIVTSGKFAMTIDGKEYTLKENDSYIIAPNVPHSGKALTDCTIIDSFCPAREEYK
jgi:unsaturated pyranuronate lyase